jgi:PucR family transcriptional regulator, purine catabolism regulatory protein
MRVDELLAEEGLQLRLHTPSSAKSLATSITFCAPAEFLDPTPFLGANCLLLTHGIGLNFSGERTWDAYVERLAGVPVCAIAFVTGAAHQVIPPALVVAAKRHKVPLLEVPSVVPALQVHRFISSVLEAERFALTKESWALADRCAKASRAGGALKAVLKEVSEATGGPSAIFDATGTVISQWPEDIVWTAEDLGKSTLGYRISSFELPMGGMDLFHLVIRGKISGELLPTLIGPASSILAMQLTNALQTNAVHETRLIGLCHQLTDWQGVALKELTRTFRAAGLDPHAPTYLVVAHLEPEELRAALRIRLTMQELLRNVQPIMFQGDFYAFAQGRIDDTVVWTETTLQLVRACRQQAANLSVVINGPTDSVDELRHGVAHAQDLVRNITEPTLAAPLGIQSLITASAGSGSHAAAVSLLAPLMHYDTVHNGQLLDTLKSYLNHNAHPSPVCQELFVHRNTLSKRLHLMTKLLNLPLDTLDGQTTCLLALRIIEGSARSLTPGPSSATG